MNKYFFMAQSTIGTRRLEYQSENYNPKNYLLCMNKFNIGIKSKKNLPLGNLKLNESENQCRIS